LAGGSCPVIAPYQKSGSTGVHRLRYAAGLVEKAVRSKEAEDCSEGLRRRSEISYCGVLMVSNRRIEEKMGRRGKKLRRRMWM
jgi:hypothetical protein